MTTTTTTAAPPPGRPLARRAAPPRPRRGADHRRLLGAAAGRQRRREPRAHRALDGARGLDRQLRRRRGGHAARPRPRRPRVLRLRGLQAARGDGVGDRPHRTTPTSTAGSARSSARVAAAQEADGYLNTTFGRPGQRPRYTDLEWGHELYCYGHLFQAAVARARTRPDADDGLLGVARRAADHVVDDVRPGRHRVASAGTPRSSRRWPSWAARPGSGATSTRPRCSSSAAAPGPWPTSSSAARTTRTTCRCGRRPSCAGTPCGPTTWPPARSTSRSRPTTTDLLDALTTQWENTVARRTYVTGGQGSQHEGEAFGDDFVLPPDRAYSETCAGVGSVMFSWRLLLAQGLPRYADLVERTLFNVVATSPSHEGTAFYYTNTLHQRRARDGPADGRREPPGVVVAARAVVRRVVLPAQRRPHAGQPGGVRRDHRRRRPAAAPVRAVPHPHDAGRRPPRRARRRDGLPARRRRPGDASATTEDRPWTLTPAGARVGATAPTLRTPGRRAAGARRARSSVHRRFAAGDVVELRLPMAPRVSSPDPRIDAVRGCVVVERGPEVLALESVDLGRRRRRPRCGSTCDAGVREVDGQRAGHRRHRARRPTTPGRTAPPPSAGGPATRGGAADRVPRLGEPGTVDDAGVAAAGVRRHPTG